jgi:hypothetical protein
MASAAGLNAISTIIGGNGLGVSPTLLANIAAYQSNSALASFANCYINAGISPSVSVNIVSELNNVGSTINSGYFLLDLYPSNVSPASSAGITAWAPNLVISVGSLISNSGKIYTTTGNVFGSTFTGNVLKNCTLTGPSGVIKKQAQLPFASGLGGFANVFINSYGYSQQVFDTVSSVNLLKDKKYSETGIGYTGPVDLVTGGLGSGARLISNVVSNWGTMYDINNITKIHDPYVFGQNLLNQGFGYINNLSTQLTNVGLDITNLPDVPAVKSETTQEEQMITVSSFVGEIEFPQLVEKTTITPVTGNSPAVVMNIYKTVTGGNLQTIVNATAITTSDSSAKQLATLADYLDLEKITSPDSYASLKALGITTFRQFSQYLGSKVGQGRFKSWADLGSFLTSLEVPTLSTLSTGANTNILYSSTVSQLNSTYGTGSGGIGNPIMIDYLGACAGDPYSNKFYSINSNYSTLASTIGITTLLSNLDRAVIDYGNAYNAYLASEVPDSAIPPAPPNGDGVPPNPALLLPISIITSNVTAVNSALSSLSTNTDIIQATTNDNTAWYVMLNRLALEISNLSRAGVVFNSGTAGILQTFAESIGQYASNKTEVQTYQFFANVITNDSYGDTIRAAVAETINSKLLSQVGIGTYNDADPRYKVYQSDSQNIPLTTYISHNK